MPNPFKRPHRTRRHINWRWISLRFSTRHCRHTWMVGTESGKRACSEPKCGVWLWNLWSFR